MKYFHAVAKRVDLNILARIPYMFALVIYGLSCGNAHCEIGIATIPSEIFVSTKRFYFNFPFLIDT